MCQKCCSLWDTLRIHEQRVLKRKAERKPLNGYHRYRFSSHLANEKLTLLRHAQYALKRSKDHLTKRVKVLREELKKVQTDLQSVCDETLAEKLSQLRLPEAQLTLIKKRVSASRYANKKSRRYTEGWLLLCLLLHIRSPSAYAFLRENDVLPLPFVSTVRKYLLLVRANFGLDRHFFDPFQRHGILVFDEVCVRKEMKVNSKTMMYAGFFRFW